MGRIMGLPVFIAALFLLGACGTQEGQNDDQQEEIDVVDEQENNESDTATENEEEQADGEQSTENEGIQVDLINTEGDTVGSAMLTEADEGVTIDVEAWNLPAGIHGFHIHEKGACEKPTFESAGGHFNPTDAQHGFDHEEGPHAGDLENMEVSEDGKVKESFKAEMVTLKEGEPNSLLQEGGTSIVIHAEEDDYISQPAGDAGDRIACGVISE